MRRLLFAATISALTLAAPALAAEPAPGPVAALAPIPEGKLTDAVRPLAYRLDLTVDPAQPRFSGHVEIDARLKRASRFIDLHGRDLAVSRAVARIGSREVVATWTQLDEWGVARLVFPEPLPAGAVTLAFDYAAPFGDGPSTLFRAKVGDSWYAWSQFESIDARGAFPAFDEPGFKVPFTLTLRTPPGLTAVGNAPETGKALEGGLEVHRFAPTLPLPTYLVAMMVGPFATLAGEVPPTPQRAAPLPLRVISPATNAGRLNFALEGSKSIVTHLENYFGEPFPFPKLDQVTSPIQSGAMENAGADLYNDGIIVLDDDASVPQKRDFGMVVAHELSHQWFGDMVTPAWWDDIWLNESFANWMGYRIGNEWRPDLNIAAGARVEGFAAMQTDALLAGRPIHQPIVRNSQIDAAFDTITYGKGGQVIAMIAAYMGDAKFRDGVHRYMAAHRYGSATSADFFKAMADVAGDSRILPAMQSFTDQQGVPLLTFSGKDGRYTVSQSRYARLGTIPPVTQWGVPLCVRQGDARACTLLAAQQGRIAVKGSGPFVPNAGGTGYFRFELPAAEWDALIDTADTLPGGEAVALADSLRASFEAGRASAAQMAALTRKLVANPDSYASGVALGGLQGINRGGFFDPPAQRVYETFVDRLYAPRLAALGFDPKVGAYAGEDPEKSQRRAQLATTLAYVAKDAPLRAQLRDAAAAYLDGKTAALDPAYIDLALGVWAEEAGLAGAQRLFALALASQDPLFRPAALDAIGTSGKPDIAQWVLTGARDPRLRPIERYQLTGGVIATTGSRDIGWAWMKENLAEMMEGAGGIFLSARLPGLVGGFCSTERAEEIAASLRPRLAGTTAELELERTIERVRSCGMLKQARSAEVSGQIAALQ